MESPTNNPTSNSEKIIQLPKIVDARGNLSFIEQENHIPFKIARSYWIYDVPGGEIRGSHAFREQEEFIIALSGSFDVVLQDGKETRTYTLNRSYMGIYVPRMTWRTLENFSTNSVCLVLSSSAYDPADYIWSFEEFLNLSLIKERKSSQLSFNQTSPQSFNNHTGPSINPISSLNTSVHQCEIFELPKNQNLAGSLTAVNNNIEIPFPIKRVYYTYDIPSGSMRGGHAHKELYQYLIAANSSFDILLDDGTCKKTVRMDKPNYALLIPPGIWRELINFSSGAICMVLASEIYKEADYIRDYNNFLNYKGCK